MAEQSEKDLIVKKAKALWADKRTYGNRLMLAGSAILAACFTFIFFGPFEMVAFGIQSLDYTYKDVFWLLLGAMAVVTVAGSLLVSLIRGKIFNYVVAVIFALTVAGYVQAALLNGSVGALTGEAVEWSRMKPEMFVSLAAWVAVFVAVITVLYFHRVFWRNMVIGVSLLLVVMQCAPMVGILLGAYEDARIPDDRQYYFTNEGMYDFSAGENVILIIMDYMDFDYIEGIYNEEPAFFDDFLGFTGYTNAVSTYGRTRPSICNILTGYTEDAYQVRGTKFMTNAWEAQETNILDVIQENDFSIEMYASIAEIFGNRKTALDYVRNVEKHADVQVSVIPGMMLRKLLYLSAYRYAPTALKPFFWEYTTFYNEDVCHLITMSSGEEPKERPSLDNIVVLNGLAEMVATREENNFKIIYIDGSHPPYYMDANGEYASTRTDEYGQTKGCLKLFKNVIARMQELGIYDEATIIVTADHGEADKMWESTFSGMRTALFYKPAGSALEPLTWSDSQVGTANIAATIAKAVGSETTHFGVALDDVGNAQMEREFYRVYGPRGEDYVDKYIISGDAKDFDNWYLVETVEVKNSFY